MRARTYARAQGSMCGLLLSLTLPRLALDLLLCSLVAARNELLEEAAFLGRIVLVAVLKLLEIGDALMGRHGGKLRVDRVTVL